MTPAHVLAAGGSGFLGTHLIEELRRRGHSVTTLVRRPTSETDESSWDPYAGTYDRAVIEAADVVVNLAGAPTAGNPHSRKWARDLRVSRVTTTAVLARAIADSERLPAFLAGNGISYYGDHGAQVLTEASDSRGHALLTDVTREWEEAARPAVDAGARVAILRTAPVMDQRAAPLKLLKPIFALGLGGRLGNGAQHMAMISLRDWVGAVVHLVEHPEASGPVNLCCPQTPTNAEFTRAFAESLHRRAFAVVPAPLLRLGGGALAPELLSSLNVRPATLEALGYEFSDHDVRDVLRAALA